MPSPFSYANPATAAHTVVPAAASAGVPGTATQQAYGLSNQGSGSQTAAIGSTVLGVAGTLVLVYLYWSLPR